MNRDVAACEAALEAALPGGAPPDLGGVPPETLDRALRALAGRHGAAAVPLLRRLAAAGPRAHRRAARLALYRLERAGVALPPDASAPPPRPVVTREAERPVRAWVSGIDGSGSRGAWILVEGGMGGGLALCSLILNDVTGIVDVTGGPTTRKRLEAEVAALGREPGLPWAETEPEHVVRLVGEALDAHARAGTRPPAGFERWRRALAAAGAAAPGAPAEIPPPAIDPALVERSAEILERPELGGWFVDPGAVQDDALQLLEARESRLVLSDHLKAEREAAIVAAVIERVLDAEARHRWARRLREMARLLGRAGQEAPVALMEAAAAALDDLERPARAIPFARALAVRGLEMAGEVALGRARPAEVSRAPRPVRPA